MPKATTSKNGKTDLRSIILNIGRDDDSAIQLAAMVFASRDVFAKLYSELTGQEIRRIDTMIDDAYERYYQRLSENVEEYKKANP